MSFTSSKRNPNPAPRRRRATSRSSKVASEQRARWTGEVTESSGNVFLDLGFPPAEAAVLLAKAELVLALKQTVEKCGLTQRAAAGLLGTDQPTLSKVMSGRTNIVTMDLLTKWLHALDQRVAVKVRPMRKRSAA